MKKTKKYFAFISYSHKDSEMAKWLQHEFEYYELPATLFDERKDLHKEDLPKSFRPVFRDEDELSGGELKPQISEALADSEYLIVVCSPNSAQSLYVDSEIREFISLSQKNKRRIFPFIVDGKPHQDEEHQEKECFPKILLELSEDETDPIELIAGDIDIHEKGRDHAFVKILAGTLKEKDIRFADLWNRYAIEKAEKERKEREDKEKLQIAQSRFVAEKAIQLVDEGDSYLARLLALKALPKDLDNPDRPYVPEAEAALRMAVDHNSAIFRGHNGAVKTAMFSPNGDYILSFSEDKTIRVWNTIDGSCINEYPYGAIAAHFITTSGNPIFVSIMNNTLQRWDVTQNNVLESKNAEFYHEKLFCFSQDGTRLYSISVREYTLHIWDVEKGEIIRSIQKDEIKGTNCMAVSSDGRLLACGAKDVIRLYDLRTENLLITYQRPHEYINHIVFNSIGDMIASSTWTTITLWNSSEDYLTRNANTITDKYLKKFNWDNHDRDVLSLFFSYDGQELISASKDRHIKIWDIDKGTCETLQGHIYDVNSALLSPDNRLMVSASSDKTIRLWDYGKRSTFRIIRLEKNTFGSYLAFSPRRDFVAVADGNIARLLDARTGECKRSFEGHENQITQLAYSPLGDTLLTTSLDDIIRLWKIETDDYYILDQAENSEFFVAYSSDGKMVVTGGQTEDKKTAVKIWNIEKIWDKGGLIKPFKIIYYDNNDLITTATFSCDNEYIIALGLFGNLYEFKVNNGCEDYYCKKVVENNIVEAGILMTPSNEHIIYTTGVGDLSNPLIYIWDRKSQTLKNPLSGHTDRVKSINLNSDGTLIVSASEDKTIKIWDVKSGVCLKTLYGHTKEVVNAVFLDDEHIISVARDNTIITWEYPSLKRLINATCDRFKNRELTDEEKRKYYLE